MRATALMTRGRCNTSSRIARKPNRTCSPRDAMPLASKIIWRHHPQTDVAPWHPSTHSCAAHGNWNLALHQPHHRSNHNKNPHFSSKIALIASGRMCRSITDTKCGALLDDKAIFCVEFTNAIARRVLGVPRKRLSEAGRPPTRPAMRVHLS